MGEKGFFELSRNPLVLGIFVGAAIVFVVMLATGSTWLLIVIIALVVLAQVLKSSSGPLRPPEDR